MEYKTLGGWSEHMHRHHPEEIPTGFTDLQYFYYTITGKKSGACVQCHKPTDWNEATGKYNRYCNNPKCKEQYCKVAKKRMIDKYGKIHLLNDPEMQRKMLSNRKIAGTYTFSDGSGKVPYVASYEKDFLMTMDTVLGFKATDIMSPSPHNYVYMYEGKPHFYIPDFYIPSLNLEVEIKDDQNGPNANKHPKIAAVDRVKEALKDDIMTKNKSINYFKVMDKSYTDFFKYVLDLKECIDDDLKNNIVIAMANESVNDPENSFEMALERALEYDDDEEFNGEGDYGFECLESVNKSKIDKDFESKGHKSLSSFKCVKLTHDVRKKYEVESKMLKHAWEDDATHDARIWLDGDKMVAHVCVFTARKKDPKYDGYKWISSLEVSPEYRGYGLGKQLLDFAVDTMGGTALGVYKDNAVAIKMYKDKGFKFLDKKRLHEKYPNYHNNAAGLMVLGDPVMESASSTESLHFETPKDLHTWMKNNFSYANFTKLLSPEELLATKKGSCHDQALFAYTYLKKMGLKPKLLFFIAYKEGEVVGGMTHTLCFYEQDNKVWWFETAWNGAIGLRSYPTENTMRVDIFRRYMNLPDAKKFPELEFKTISPEKPGVNLAQYVDKALEVALTTDERTDFGIPSLKKYPMPDPDHVKAAIRMFNHVDDEHEEELANNILKYIKKYKMTDINVGKDNRFHKYYSPSEDAVITDVASQVPYGGSIIQRPMN